MGAARWFVLFKFKTNTVGDSPTASYLLLLRQKKVTEEKATPVRRCFAVPCVARLVRPPHKLARPATRSRAQTYSSEFPDQPALLGGAQGKANQNPKPQHGHFVPMLLAYRGLGLSGLRLTMKTTKYYGFREQSMTNIRSIDMMFLDDVFDMGSGYVLNFSDRTFQSSSQRSSTLTSMFLYMPETEVQKQSAYAASFKPSISRPLLEHLKLFGSIAKLCVSARNKKKK
jgi:hypothetical protein